MRIVHLVAAAVVLAAAGGIIQRQSGFAGQPPAVSDEITGSIRPDSDRSDIYGIAFNGSKQGCVLRLGRQIDARSRQLELSAGCEDAPISSAKVWIERPNGDVALAAADGRPLVEFGASDGAAFESFRPAQPMMTLTLSR